MTSVQRVKLHNEGLQIPPDVQERLYTGLTTIFGVDIEMLRGDSRTRMITHARWAAVLALRAWDSSIVLEQLAVAIYRTDHTTALHGLRRGQTLAAGDPAFRRRVQTLIDQVGHRVISDFNEDGDRDYWREQAYIWRSRFVAAQDVIVAIRVQTEFAGALVAPMLAEVGLHSEETHEPV